MDKIIHQVRAEHCEYYGAAGSSANIRFLPLNIVMHIV